MRARPGMLAVAIACWSCGGSTGTEPSAAVPVPAATPVAPAATTSGAAQVVIAFYFDARCEPGTEVGSRRYDTGASCFSWFAQGSHAQENSATSFQCWRDRLCYTQHPDSMSCASALATPKESRVGECLKEPAGQLYSRILSGTESCPPAPPGFQCPRR